MAIPAGCASQADLRRQQQELATLKAEIQSIQKELRSIAELQLRIEELRGELRRLQGGGSRRRRPARARSAAKLTPVKGRLRIKLPNAIVMRRAGSTPSKKALSGHLREFDGYVIAFWATWCKPCIADGELDKVRQLRRALRAKNVELISMAVDELDDVRGHAKVDSWIYPLWQRDDGHMEMLPRRFIEDIGLGLPLFVLVGSSGTISHYLKSDLKGDAVSQIVAAASAP